MNEVRISHLVAVVLDVLLHLAAVLPPLHSEVGQDGGDHLEGGRPDQSQHYAGQGRLTSLSLSDWSLSLLLSMSPLYCRRYFL